MVPILYEDRSVLAVDKPRGWMLAPDSWDRTGRNLQLALTSSLSNGDFWARSRNLKYLRFVHRLDADTNGVLLLAKSPGALSTFSALFESRRVEKTYLAVVRGVPKNTEWICRDKIGEVAGTIGLMRVDARNGLDAETSFRVLQTGADRALVEARPATGRTHQIRVHLASSGHPVLGDAWYGPEKMAVREGFVRLALRATRLAYPDPFLRRVIQITAPVDEFLREFGFTALPREARPAPGSKGGEQQPKPLARPASPTGARTK